ncbi:MAG: helix-turn-helix domain-containing protein, partial [Chloroflexota bacterium]
MSLEEAAHAIGVHDTRGRTGAERLAALEAGQEEPSRSVLQNMARKYHRSLLIFYLDAPPKVGDRGQDFRLAPNAGPPAYNATLDALIRDIKSRQRLVRSLLEDEDAVSIPYVGSATMSDGPSALAERITEVLSFRLAIFRERGSVGDAFSYLRARIEGAGIFVLLAGNLGSHHSNLPADIFRGFAISDPIAPFIVINDQDARAAWSFTALHEVAHVWLGTTGVSGAAAGTALERLC